MRTINYRALFILAAILIVGSATVYVVHRLQMRRQAPMLLEEARKAAKDPRTAPEERFRDVSRAYNRYFQMVPDDVEARQEYADYLLAARRGVAAFEAYQQVLRSDPTLETPRRNSAKILLMLRRYNEAKKDIDLLLQKPENAKDAELLRMLAQCRIESKDYKAALEALESVQLAHPEDLDAYMLAAAVYKQYLNDPKNADARLDAMVKANPENVKALLLRASRREAWNRPQEAVADVEAALAMAPKNLEVLMVHAQLALRTGRAEEARQATRRVLQLAPNAATPHLVLAALAMQENQVDKAIAELEEGCRKDPKEFNILWRLFQLYLDAKKPKEAATVVKRIRELPDSKLIVQMAEAEIACLEGKWEDARSGLEQARTALADRPDYLRGIELYLAECYRNLHDTDQEILTLRRLILADPEFLVPRRHLVSALLRLGKTDEAMREQTTLISLPGAVVNDVPRLVRMKLAALNPQTASPQEWAEIDAALAAARKVAPGAEEVILLQAQALRARNLLAEADRLVSKARDASPKQIEYWNELVSIALSQRDWPKVETVLADAEKAVGDSGAVRLLRARYAIQRYAGEAKPHLRKLAENTSALKPEELAALQADLATMAFGINDLEQAKQWIRAALTKMPDNLQAHLAALQIALRSGSAKDADEAIANIRRLDAEGAVLQMAEAIRLRDRLKPDDKAGLREVVAILEKAKKLNPNHSRIPLLLGDTYDKLDDKPKAVENYLLAFSQGEREPEPMQRTVFLLSQLERYAEADALLRRLPSLPSGMKRLATLLASQANDTDRTLQMAREAAAGSKDAIDHHQLGQALTAAASQAVSRQADPKTVRGLVEEAEKAMRRAVELSPTTPEYWLTLVRLLAQTNRAAEAEKLLPEIRSKVSPAAAAMTAAKSQALCGKLDEAAKSFEALLTEKPNDLDVLQQVIAFFLQVGRPEKAMPLLESIAEGKVKTNPATVATARRRMAAVLLSQKSADDRKKARELIAKNLAESPDSAEDRRLNAVILGSQGGRRDRREAVAILEEAAKRNEASPQDRFFLAQLYLADQDWNRFNGVMRTLLASQGREPQYLLAFVEGLLQQKNPTEAETWLRQAEELLPSNSSVIRLRARLEQTASRFDLALKAIKQLLPKKDSPEQNIVPLVALELEQMAASIRRPQDAAKKTEFLGEAERLLREFATNRPEGRKILSGFLARQRRFDEAVKLFEQDAEQLPPPEIAAFGGSLLAQDAPETYQKRYETHLQKALTKQPDSLPLILSQADLLSRRKQFDRVEKIYRDLLAKEPDNIFALNNLSVLLALQGKDVAQASQMIDQAIRRAGPDAVLLDSRATVLMAAGKFDDALADLDEAVIAEAKALRLFHKAQAYFEKGDKTAARKAWQDALDAGQTREQLHSLEQPVFDKLQQALSK